MNKWEYIFWFKNIEKLKNYFVLQNISEIFFFSTIEKSFWTVRMYNFLVSWAAVGNIIEKEKQTDFIAFWNVKLMVICVWVIYRSKRAIGSCSLKG